MSDRFEGDIIPEARSRQPLAQGWEMLVVAGLPYPPNFVVRGPALEGLLPRQTSHLAIISRDIHGNRCPRNTSKRWEARIDQLVLRPKVSSNGHTSVEADWLYCKPPLFEFAPPGDEEADFYLHLDCERAGVHVLFVREENSKNDLEWLRVKLHVSPGAYDPDAFMAFGDGLRRAEAGKQARIVILPRAFVSPSQAERTFAGIRAWLQVDKEVSQEGGKVLTIQAFRRQHPIEASSAGFGNEQEHLHLKGLMQWRVSGWDRCAWDEHEWWELLYTSPVACKSSKLHIELFGRPICGSPYDVVVE